MTYRLLVGCYTKGHEPLAYYTNHAEQGAYVVDLNNRTGKLSVSHGPVDAGTNPTYAAFDPKSSTAYFTNENLEKGCIKAFRLDHGVVSKNNFLLPLNSEPVPGNHPCFVAWYPKKQQVLCANYVSGDLSIFDTLHDGSLRSGFPVAAWLTPIPTDGTFPGPVAARQDKPHAHCYAQLGDTGFGLCCDLGSDQVLCLRIASGEVISRCKLSRGSGPRHVAVSKDAKWLYVSTELDNTIVAIPADPATGKLGPFAAAASLQPEGCGGPATSASHIELSTCGKFAFVANRVGVANDGGCQNAVEGTVSVFKLSPKTSGAEHLKLVEHKLIGGKVPRSFCVAGKWLVVGAQESSMLRSFSIGPAGNLIRAHDLSIPSPGVVVQAGLAPTAMGATKTTKETTRAVKAVKDKPVKRTMKRVVMKTVMKKKAMKARRGRLM